MNILDLQTRFPQLNSYKGHIPIKINQKNSVSLF